MLLYWYFLFRKKLMQFKFSNNALCANFSLRWYFLRNDVIVKNSFWQPAKIHPWDIVMLPWTDVTNSYIMLHHPYHITVCWELKMWPLSFLFEFLPVSNVILIRFILKKLMHFKFTSNTLCGSLSLRWYFLRNVVIVKDSFWQPAKIHPWDIVMLPWTDVTNTYIMLVREKKKQCPINDTYEYTYTGAMVVNVIRLSGYISASRISS